MYGIFSYSDDLRVEVFWRRGWRSKCTRLLRLLEWQRLDSAGLMAEAYILGNSDRALPNFSLVREYVLGKIGRGEAAKWSHPAIGFE